MRKYDKESVYDEKISPLMTEIIRICKEHDIKMIADFYLKEETSEQGELHCTTLINDGESNAKIGDMYKIVNGWIAQKPFFMAMKVTKGNQEE